MSGISWWQWKVATCYGSVSRSRCAQLDKLHGFFVQQSVIIYLLDQTWHWPQSMGDVLKSWCQHFRIAWNGQISIEHQHVWLQNMNATRLCMIKQCSCCLRSPTSKETSSQHKSSIAILLNMNTNIQVRTCLLKKMQLKWCITALDEPSLACLYEACSHTPDELCVCVTNQVTRQKWLIRCWPMLILHVFPMSGKFNTHIKFDFKR